MNMCCILWGLISQQKRTNCAIKIIFLCVPHFAPWLLISQKYYFNVFTTPTLSSNSKNAMWAVVSDSCKGQYVQPGKHPTTRHSLSRVMPHLHYHSSSQWSSRMCNWNTFLWKIVFSMECKVSDKVSGNWEQNIVSFSMLHLLHSALKLSEWVGGLTCLGFWCLIEGNN